MKQLFRKYRLTFLQHLFPLLFLLLPPAPGHAQRVQDSPGKAQQAEQTTRVPKLCKEPTANQPAIRAATEYLLTAQRQQNGNKLVRVYFHICRNDDGLNAGATLEQIESEFADLIADFASANICFANMGVDFIDDTPINTMLNPDIPATVVWLDPFLVPNCLNIFYHAALASYGGNAYEIPNTFCSIANGNIGLWRTISHEVGHCLGLHHTFRTADGEGYISGFECLLNGDLVCDTPADPYHGSDPCFIASNCAYNGNCTDPADASNYSPPYFNIMSYWGSEGCDVDVISAGQYARANATLETYAPLIGTLSSNALTYGPVSISSGYVLKSACLDLSTAGSVVLTNSVEACLQGENVTINPGFVALPTSGSILLRSTQCQ